MDFIDLKTGQKLIKENLDKRIAKVLAHGKYIMGPEVKELEDKLAEYVGVKHCLTCANGTDALQIALMAVGAGIGDEVITTPFTFIATAETAAVLGAKPIFVDIDSKTYNLDPEKLEEKITKKTKAIVPVSIYGQCAAYDKINAIAKKYNIPVIEDAAQSFGATYKNRKSGSLTDIACTSFFPTKPLGCYGDGGALFTNDDELAKKINTIRLHGQAQRYNHVAIGINSRLDTLQAAILLAKLEILDKEIKLRLEVANRYTEMLNNKNVVTPYIEEFNTSVYAQYTILVENRKQLQEKLTQENIPTAVHYPIPLHLQPVFEKLGGMIGDYPIAEDIANRVLSLPMSAYISKEEQAEVVSNLYKNIS